VIAEACVWQARHGGRVFNLYPYALSAEIGLAQLERMPAYYEWMLAFADAIRGDERIVLRPDPPQSPLVHVNLRAEWEPLREAVLDLAEEQGGLGIRVAAADLDPRLDGVRAQRRRDDARVRAGRGRGARRRADSS
jgi:hypothetical protein